MCACISCTTRGPTQYIIITTCPCCDHINLIPHLVLTSLCHHSYLWLSYMTVYPFSLPPPPLPPLVPRVLALKRMIQKQTGVDPVIQELFYENLPYSPRELIAASKLPNTTVGLISLCLLDRTVEVKVACWCKMQGNRWYHTCRYVVISSQSQRHLCLNEDCLITFATYYYKFS